MDKSSISLQCSKCGYIPTAPARTCIKCGGTIKVKCQQCSFLSEWGRHFCEKCGNPLPSAPAVYEEPEPQKKPEISKFKLEIQSLQDAVDEIGDSFRRKIKDISKRGRISSIISNRKAPAQNTTAKTADKQKKSQAVEFVEPKTATRQKEHKQAVKGKETEIRKKSSKANNTSAAAKDNEKSTSKKFFAYLIVLALIGGLGFGIYHFFVKPFVPGIKLTIAAKNYLTAFTKGNYEEAYKMISSNSKIICPLEDYLFYNKQNFTTGREFRNIKIHSIKPNTALVKYQIRNKNGQWTDDYTSFIFEHDTWVRPYVWTLYQPLDEALNRKDYIQALYLAQRLFITDPASPISSGYLCMAEYNSGLYDKSSESCANALELMEDYPTKIPEEDLNWILVYAANSLAKQGRTRAAIDAYDKAAEKKNLTPAQSCDAKLNRAEMFLKNSDYSKAANDLFLAAARCPNNDPNKPQVDWLLKQLKGQATQEAILFAKRSQINTKLPTVEEIRREFMRKELRKLGLRGLKYATRDYWKAEYIGNMNYKVTLHSQALSPITKKIEGNDIFIVIVNLWRNTGKIEKPLPKESL